MRIVLVRHAPVRFSASRWVSAGGVRDAVARYNLAPIRSAAVPHDLERLIQPASVVLASSLARSIHTAELLARGREVGQDRIFDEAVLPAPRGKFPLLPVRVWFIVLRVLWLLGWANGAEPKSRARLRAKEAAHRLVRASGADHEVVLVGHGIFMAFMARALQGRGWRRIGSLPRRPWSACCFAPPAHH